MKHHSIAVPLQLNGTNKRMLRSVDVGTESSHVLCLILVPSSVPWTKNGFGVSPTVVEETFAAIEPMDPVMLYHRKKHLPCNHDSSLVFNDAILQSGT